jgi:MFS family permease
MYVTVRGLPKGPPGATKTVSGTVILLGLTSMFTDISAEMVVAVLPMFATAILGLSPLAYGIVDGLYQGVATFVRVGGGMAADMSGRPKAVAVSGYGLSAVCKLALLPVTSGAALATVVAVDRTGKGIRTAPRDAMIAASTQPNVLGRAFGVHRAMDTAGALAGPLIAFAILAAIPNGFNEVFLVSFAAALMGLAVLVFLVPNVRSQATEHRRRVSARDVCRLAVSPQLRRLLVAAVVLSALSIGDGFLYLALQRREEFAAQYFPLLFAGTALVYLVLAIPFGRLADRFGRVRVFLVGHLALAAAYAVAAGIGSGVASVLACLALLGAFYAATDGVIAAAAAGRVPAQLRGSGIALAQTAVAAGRLVAGVAFGSAWSLVGRDAALYGFAVLLLVVLAGVTLIWRRT